MPFRFQRLRLPDVILIEAQEFEDARGVFKELYERSTFVANGLPDMFVQDNYSRSVRGVLRGLHYQKPPKEQGKLVMALRGEIFDVAVDIRRSSPTYGQWLGITLVAQAHQSLYVPVGFAHGFCVLSTEAEVVYKVTKEYAPAYERGIRWNDPAIGIDWPIQDPLLSAKDAQLPFLDETERDTPYEGPRR